MSTDWDVRPAWAPPDQERPAPTSRRRLALRVSLVAASVLLVVGGVAEWWGRSEAAAQVTDGLVQAGVTGDVAVGIGTGAAPSVLRAAALGRLDRVRVLVRDGQLGGVPVVRADYRLWDLDVDVGLRSGTVQVDRIGGGSVRMVLDPAVVGASLGADLRVRDGRLLIGSPAVPARARVDGDELVIEPRRRDSGVEPVRAPAADPYLLPCRPTVRVVDRSLELRCRGHRLPGVLAGPLGVGAGGGGGSSGDVPVGELPPPQTTLRDGG